MSSVDFRDTMAQIDSILGVTDAPAPSSASLKNIQTPGADELKKVINGQGSEIDLSKEQGDKNTPAIPTYYTDEEKGILGQKYPEKQADNTNYKDLAVQNFGPGFAFINDRESYENRLFEDEQYRSILSQQPAVSVIDNILNDRYPVRDVFLTKLSQGMDKDDPDYEERLAAKVDQYFDGEKLNDKGKSRYNDFKNEYKGHLESLKNDAQRIASDRAKEFIEYKSALTTKLKDLSIGGMKASEEFSGYIEEIIRSQKHLEEDGLDLGEKIDREIWLAIGSDKKALLEFIRMVDQRGIEFGQSQGMRNFFKN